VQELIAELIEATKAYRLAREAAWAALSQHEAAKDRQSQARAHLERVEKRLRAEIQAAAGYEDPPDAKPF
jgi:hypothetical protein